MLDRLIDFLLSIIDLFRFWQVIDAFERAVVLRFGKHVRTLEPGIHWLAPLAIERVLIDNVVPRTIEITTQTLTTKDGVTCLLGGVVTAHIADIEKALLGVEGVDHALTDAVMGTFGDHVAASTWDEIADEKFAHELTKACRRAALRYGIYIERVQLGSRAKCRAYRIH